MLYLYISTYLKYFINFNIFEILKGTLYTILAPENGDVILKYAELNPVMYTYTNSSGEKIITTNSLEEYESANGLDSNNRPFKIITKEEFDKDLTEEEARKISSEL